MCFVLKLKETGNILF